MISGTRLLTLLLLLLALPASAQLQASFRADKTSGCAPLTVQFTNTSVGAGAAAAWNWTFSNGNASHFKDPAALFTEPGTYTVTLKAAEGSAASEQSLVITVHAAPRAVLAPHWRKAAPRCP